MTNITAPNLSVSINLTKLSNYNQTLNINMTNNLNTFINSIFNVFAQYPILQWFIIITIFIAIFIPLRNQTYLNLTDTQVIVISSFITASVNTLLLIAGIFTILQPLETMFLLWLLAIISIFVKSNN